MLFASTCNWTTEKNPYQQVWCILYFLDTLRNIKRKSVALQICINNEKKNSSFVSLFNAQWHCEDASDQTNDTIKWVQMECHDVRRYRKYME